MLKNHTRITQFPWITITWLVAEMFRKHPSVIFIGSCAWHGVSVWPKSSSSWPGCQKLHVSNILLSKYLHLLFSVTTMCKQHLFTLRLDRNMIIKVADFGLSREVQNNDYYKVENTSVELPVRWMSPESLTDWIFTTKSDVVCTIGKEEKPHISL